MKTEILAYVTCLFDAQSNKIKHLKSFEATELVIGKHEEFKGSLGDLLDFVEDIPEIKQQPINITVNIDTGEVEELKHVITVLEGHKASLYKQLNQLRDVNKLFIESESKLVNQIQILQGDKSLLQNTCDMLRKELEGVSNIEK